MKWTKPKEKKPTLSFRIGEKAKTMEWTQKFKEVIHFSDIASQQKSMSFDLLKEEFDLSDFSPEKISESFDDS